MAGTGGSRRWRTLSSRNVLSDRWLTLRIDEVEAPDGAVRPPAPVIELPDWVDIIALTPDRRVLLVDQYRHPIQRVSTEFPAGVTCSPETLT